MTGELMEEHAAAYRGDACAAPDLEQLFAPHKSGYLGADAALSIPISDTRTLWVFGDTLMGEIVDGRRRFDAMPRNSAAIVTQDGHRPVNVEWILSEAHDFLVPPSSGGERWFWPGTGFARAGKVYVIGYDVENGSGPCESLAFRLVGCRLFRISGFDGPASEWHKDSVEFTMPGDSIMFCSATLEEDGYLHLLGYARGHEGTIIQSGAVMARIPIEDIDTGDPAARMEVIGSSPANPRWLPANAAPVALFQPGVSECSLYHDAPRRRYIATTYDTREGVMRVTTAPSLKGPWCKPLPVYRVPEFRGPDIHHAYTFRMHPELAANPDEMIFTYVVNTKTLETVLEELDVYFPRFVRADLRRI